VGGCGEATPPAGLVTRARRVVAAALASPAYRKLSAFHLGASPDLSGGDDKLASVRELGKRLEKRA
jgi:hypothetical protein